MGDSLRSPAPAGRLPSRTIRWGLALVAIAYVGYLALLITCDLLRVEPLGFVPAFADSRVTVESVQPGSVAARQGLRPNDRLIRANGQILSDRLDWQRVRVQLDPSRPLEIEIDRGGRPSTVRLPLSAGMGEWLSGPPRPGLVGFRLAQIITLSLALLVAFRRASQPAALLRAWLLASFATVSYVLPMRMFHVWQGLPQPLEALLWLPHATSTSFGPLLFAFVAVFPRRSWSTSRLLVALLPGAVAMGWFAYMGYHLAQDPGAATGLPDSRVWLVSTGSLYAFAAVAMLLAHQRAADSATDRRRFRVLLGGLTIGVSAGAALLIVDGSADIFGNSLLTVLALASLAVPASFAHAILRHRLFDLRVIVRQGVRYALARRLLDALLPAVTALLLAELIWHGDQPLAEMVRSRWWWYILIVGALVLIRDRRVVADGARSSLLPRAVRCRAPARERRVPDQPRAEFRVDRTLGGPADRRGPAPHVRGSLPARSGGSLVRARHRVAHLGLAPARSHDGRRRDVGPAPAPGAVARGYRMGTPPTPSGGAHIAVEARHRTARPRVQRPRRRPADCPDRAGSAPVRGTVRPRRSRPVGQRRRKPGTPARAFLDRHPWTRGVRPLRSMLRRRHRAVRRRRQSSDERTWRAVAE